MIRFMNALHVGWGSQKCYISSYVVRDNLQYVVPNAYHVLIIVCHHVTIA